MVLLTCHIFIQTMLSDFGLILLFTLGGFFLFGVVMTIARFVRKDKPNEEKLSTYESGEAPTGNASVRFNNRFYVIALVFVLFDVELIFLFPWATVFGNEQFITETNGLWGWFAILEMFIFVFVLVIGLAYVWRRGYIDWIKPVQKENTFTTKIPKEYYERINQKYS